MVFHRSDASAMALTTSEPLRRRVGGADLASVARASCPVVQLVGEGDKLAVSLTVGARESRTSVA
jgi:hypothetical protein